MRFSGLQTAFRFSFAWGVLLMGVMGLFPDSGWSGTAQVSRLRQTVTDLASFGDRSTGTKGARAAGAYIKKRFADLGVGEIQSHRFSLPVLQADGSRMEVEPGGPALSLNLLFANAISPETIAPQGLEGPLVYAGSGHLKELNGKTIEGAIILMELDSGKNWLNVADLGAKALVYIDRGKTTKFMLEEKFELTPLRFPRLWVPASRLREHLGSFETAPRGLVAPRVRLFCDSQWQRVTGENIYGLIAGQDPELAEELMVVEAFYDSKAWVLGNSPGADEAVGIATLLELAGYLKQHPPRRSVLLLATDGHAQSLAGMREFIWCVAARSKDQRDIKKSLNATVTDSRRRLEILQHAAEIGPGSASGTALKEALEDQLKSEVDRISRELMRLRMAAPEEKQQDLIKAIANERLVMRRLGWRSELTDLSGEELEIIRELIPKANGRQKTILADAKRQLSLLRDVSKVKAMVKTREVAAMISLHLSSHGDGLGAFNRGWLYPLKESIDRVGPYSQIDQALRNVAADVASKMDGPALFQDTLRPSRLRTWQSFFGDQPFLGGEVSSMAGYVGITLATVNDSRGLWGTPRDTVGHVDWQYAGHQSEWVNNLIGRLTEVPDLKSDSSPRVGFGEVTARANFLRHGELFADQPAPGSMILAYQGPGIYYAMVDAMGKFALRGMAYYKHVIHKVIIEGYRFEPQTGRVQWAIDKNQTGKDAYRVKMRRRFMETDLVMFACKETTLFNLLEPRNFAYMTRLQLIDARRESTPLRYWYSRIDTRESVIASIYLDPEARLKLTLSDTVLRKKMILTNGRPSDPQGIGYLVDKWPAIHRTEFRVARDMWTLLAPRITNLERHGIYNERIRRLQDEGLRALSAADKALDALQYEHFVQAATRSWALASRVYDDVEKTQKDVLFGVLFYIALFVPFAFCLERLLFCYSNIHKRIIAFCAILVLLIAVIYFVHPAFQLAYSPMVVILAFFIMGLSLVVTLIIFFRFEKEMIQLQSRADHLQTGEMSRWKSFVASFFLGVTNLRRRRLRTVLTCVTLIILTFTIMSFTSVKSLRRHARVLFQPRAAYQGFLLKNVNWLDLPPESMRVFNSLFGKGDAVGPRVWLEDEDRTRTTRIPVRRNDLEFEARGMVGLAPQEPRVTGISKILVGGRWFRPEERHAILIPERLATGLGIDSANPQAEEVRLWGMRFNVVGVFSGDALRAFHDLDGEPLTPATFPSEVMVQMSEAEEEALESGEDIRAFQSRYQHTEADLTVIIPSDTLLALNGHLKGVAIRAPSDIDIRETAQELVDRFGLSLFSGEPGGTYLYNASDTLSYSGVPNIAIPIIISIFIVLNTMIGSVYERKNEIGIYTSVGLAPSHVSFLFIAEALAFAILSVVLGYLFAQTAASLLSGTVLWSGITVNYSSLAGVAAMLLVILVVLVSVLYPSKVAGEIAMPDVQRSWTLPEARGNVLELTLPFLMKDHEYQSIAGYLYEYFNSHIDISHGLFSTGDLHIDSLPSPESGRPPDPTTDAGPPANVNPAYVTLRSRVWLAPFDFGIMQRVKIQFLRSAEDAAFLEIRVRLVRESGEVDVWRRINKVFLHKLRRQLLIWRSLGEAGQARYERLLNETLPSDAVDSARRQARNLQTEAAG